MLLEYRYSIHDEDLVNIYCENLIVITSVKIFPFPLRLLRNLFHLSRCKRNIFVFFEENMKFEHWYIVW